MSVTYATIEDRAKRVLEDESASPEQYKTVRLVDWFNMLQDELARSLPEGAAEDLVVRKLIALDGASGVTPAGAEYALPASANEVYLKFISAEHDDTGTKFTKVDYADALRLGNNFWTTPSKRQPFCYIRESYIGILPDSSPFQANNIELVYIRRPTQFTVDNTATACEFAEEHVPILVYALAGMAVSTSESAQLSMQWFGIANNLLNNVWMETTGQPSPYTLGQIMGRAA